jgi:hypothetical protein
VPGNLHYWGVHFGNEFAFLWDHLLLPRLDSFLLSLFGLAHNHFGLAHIIGGNGGNFVISSSPLALLHQLSLLIKPHQKTLGLLGRDLALISCFFSRDPSMLLNVL